MDKSLEKVLIESLDDLEKGRPIEEILSEHSDQAEELRPVLEMANNLQTLKVAHSVGAQANSLDNFLAVASAKGAASGRSNGSFWFALRRLAAVLGAVALLLVIVGSTLAFASQSAVPGDSLYGAKLAIEDFRLSLVNEGPDRESLNTDFNQNRIDEIEELIERNRDASNLEFRGIIESIDGSSWVISGLPIKVDGELISADQLEIGQRVVVIVDVANGEALAISIMRTSPIEPAPEPETEATQEPEDALEADPEPSPSMTPTLTPSLTPTTAPTQTPSPESVLSPTETPDPEIDDTPEFEEEGEEPDEDDSPEEDESDDSSEEPEDDFEENNGGSNSGSDHEEGESDDDSSGSSDSDSESEESDDEPDEEEEPDEDDEPDEGDKEP